MFNKVANPHAFTVRHSCLTLLATLLTGLSPQLDGQFVAGGLNLPSRDAQSYLPPIGGPGGGQFKVPCHNGQYLNGVELRVGDDVDAIRPICADSTSVTSANNPFSGGPGGRPLQLRCPMNTPTVIALGVGAEGAETVVVNNVHLYCGQLIPNQKTPDYPSAVFDGPVAVSSKPPLGIGIGGAPIRTAGNFQACPAGQVATGVHGRSGVWLDAVGLICAPLPAAPAPQGEPAKAIGRIAPTFVTSQGSVCDSAASAKARKSPAAPSLEAVCAKLQGQIAANEKQDLTPGASGTPVSICDAAQSALDRNAIEAADLSVKCRATGGGQNLTTQADQYAAAGQAIVASDTLLAALRSRQPAGAMRKGFDVGVAVVGSQTEWGPGKQKIMDSLKPDEQEGFKVAASFVMDRNRNAMLAATGASIADADPEVAQARTQDPDVRYWLGFDIASAIFGDPALGAQGNTATGPGSDKIRNGLSAPAQKGFLAAVRFHLSRRH